MNTNDRWHFVSGQSVFEHPVLNVKFDLFRRGDGKKKNFVTLESPDWVNVVPITPDGQVVLIRQYRFGVDDYTLEIPGGLVDPGEQPIEAGAREMLEETGFTSPGLVPIGKVSPNPALFTNTCHTFLAPGAQLNGRQRLDDDENIEVITRPAADLPGLVSSGAIDHCLVIAALTFYWLHQDGGPLASM